MSSYLRGSSNYVWSTTSILGKGATATVHQGVNKATGEPVAVKTFNHISTLRPVEVQFREFDVLKKVNHENIVKLIAIEEEQENRGKVIVMELCTGGSLFSILDDPENTYGLEENEFMLVLKHLVAGMKHLRDLNLVHRDLKPGNIMKFIKDDGTTIYKLTDFGAARELQDDQHFQSLYGTEEYLHPDMYERAVLKKHANKTFGATIDLWSIGVTLYHVATGNLPFQPYGGRKNKETMYHITTKKESGVISGVQTKDGGPIEWKRELPSRCQLSYGLKKVITPLLAGLLEADAKKIWSFDRFFKEVNSVLSRICINIFYVNNARLIKVYIHKDDTYEQLQSYIKEQTSMAEESQVILVKSSILLDLIDLNTTAAGLPKTQDSPFFLFNKDNNNIALVPDSDVPKFNDFPNVISVESDAAHAKFACSIGHLCKRRVESYSLHCKLIWEAVESFTKYIKTELKQLHQSCKFQSEKSSLLTKTVDILELSQQISNYKKKGNKVRLKELKSDFDSVIEPSITFLFDTHYVKDTFKLQWDSMSRELVCPSRSLAPARARTHVEHLRDSWQHLVRDRATRSLSYNDEQFHILERIKIGRTVAQFKELLEKEVLPQYQSLAEVFEDWYKISQNIHLKTRILHNDLDKFENSLRDLEDEVSIDNVDYTEFVRNNLEKVRKCNGKKAGKVQRERLLDSINEYQKLQAELSQIVKENAFVVNNIKNELREEELDRLCVKMSHESSL